MLGDEHVLVLGSHRVDLAALKQALVDRGFGDILCEGGPHLLRDLLDQGVADEVACTFVPRLVSGLHPRITDGPPVDVHPAPAHARRGGRHPAGALVHRLTRPQCAIQRLVSTVRMTRTRSLPSVWLAPDVEARERAERDVPARTVRDVRVGRVGPIGVAHRELGRIRRRCGRR